MDNKAKIIALGIDYQEVMDRFAHQEALYMKFLYKFCDDAGYQNLLNAVHDENYDAIEKAAHMMKGTTANLGMKQLSEACHIMVADVRAKQCMEQLMVDLSLIKELYETLIAQLQLDRGCV